MGVNSLPKTVTPQRRGCDLNPGLTEPESSTLSTQTLNFNSTASRSLSQSCIRYLLKNEINDITLCTKFTRSSQISYSWHWYFQVEGRWPSLNFRKMLRLNFYFRVTLGEQTFQFFGNLYLLILILRVIPPLSEIRNWPCTQIKMSLRLSESSGRT